MAAVIETYLLTKRYGARCGIEDVTFSVEEGEVFGLVGGSGAGKTTVVRLLVGAIRPTSGRALVLGRESWNCSPEAHRRMAFLGGDTRYPAGDTCREHLERIAGVRGLTPDAWHGLAERFGLDASGPIRKLTRSDRRKLGFIAAFMGEEPLVILDAPTSGLDPLAQRAFFDVLRSVSAAGRSVLLSSRDLAEVKRSCDRVGMLSEGRLVQLLSAADMRGDRIRSVRLVCESEPSRTAFDVPNVQVVSASSLAFHLLVRGDLNPLLGRLGGLRIRDVTICEPRPEDLTDHVPPQADETHESVATLPARLP